VVNNARIPTGCLRGAGEHPSRRHVATDGEHSLPILAHPDKAGGTAILAYRPIATKPPTMAP
jgi:hypothetical protein